jgi:murein DD-endopeptidase MepM/ murein hydrolase activator NlpD
MKIAVLLVVLALVPSTALAQMSPIRPDPMVPVAYAPTRGGECTERERGTGLPDADICDGPRRVAVSEGEAAERAERLGLGTRPAGNIAFTTRVPEAWVAEIPSAPRQDLLWPVARGLFSMGFGNVRREQVRHIPHQGIDIVAQPGAHIRAANDGLVVYADNTFHGFGNLLILVHADATVTIYGHCRAIYAAPGQLVSRGQVVAEVGRTGRPFVEHLHFEWRRRGEAMDPMRHLVERPDPREIRPDPSADTFEPPPPNVRPVEQETRLARAEE